MASRNRTAGHNWERECIKDLKVVFPSAISSRMESKRADDAGKDICNTGDFDFQCKNTAKKLDYDEVLDDIETDGIKVILHKLTEKKGNRFIVKDKYAIMKYEDFIDLLINMDLVMNPSILDDSQGLILGKKLKKNLNKMKISKIKSNIE